MDKDGQQHGAEQPLTARDKLHAALRREFGLPANLS